MSYHLYRWTNGEQSLYKRFNSEGSWNLLACRRGGVWVFDYGVTSKKDWDNGKAIEVTEGEAAMILFSMC